MRWAAIVLVALVGCSSPPAQAPELWDAPPAQWVSDLTRFEAPHTYNRYAGVSDGGRWVVFSSDVEGGPVRVFLVNTRTGAVRYLDDSFDGGPRRSPGVRRYTLAGIDPQITPNGRFVVFSSAYSNVIRNDTNDAVDIFVYDRVAKKTRIVSRSSKGRQSNMGSYNPAISADGRYVVFDSRANNLVPKDSDFRSDVYRKDLATGELELISIGAQGKGNGWSTGPDVSDDGTRVSFGSRASNLVEDDTNQLQDIFVRDIDAQETLRASVTTEGDQYESFQSEESASVYNASVNEAEISGNGEVVVFTGNANGLVAEDFNYNDDVFVHDLSTSVTERVSVRNDGGDAYGDESVECGKDPVCAQFMSTHSPSISADGSKIYFISAAPLLSDEDDDTSGSSTEQAFLRDRIEGKTLLVSRYRNGIPVESANWHPGAVSADGQWVTYCNDSKRLDGRGGDRDGNSDVFLQRLPD
jgi:Tol biopolymer transport system component